MTKSFSARRWAEEERRLFEEYWIEEERAEEERRWRIEEERAEEESAEEELDESINPPSSAPRRLYPMVDKDGNLTAVEARPHRRAFVPWWMPIIYFSECGEKPGDAPHLTMPDIGQKLLPFILPRKDREVVAGDLAEDFRRYATERGRLYALCLFWWDFGGLCIRHFGPTALITAIGALLRQKLGL